MNFKLPKAGVTSFLLFLPLALFSQITITQSHMPVSGDTIRYSTASAIGLGFDPKQTGASQSWDFSSLQSSGQGLYEYLSANKTPYFFYFFNQLGLKTIDSIGVATFSFKNIYSFYSKSSTVFKAEGLGYSVAGVPLAANYTDEDEIYQFPLSFNDSDVTSFRFVFSIPGQTTFSFIQAGKRTNVVDGWGSLKTPFKTYDSVIRVRTFMNEVDTIVTQFAKIPVPRRQMIFKWLSTTEKIPVLEITGTMVNNTFTPTEVRYRDSFNGMKPPLAPTARFDIDKTTGFVDADTFSLTDETTPFATSFQWQITPSADVRFVNGTSATSRNPQVVFGQRGKFSVSLTATNFSGSDDTSAADLITIEYGIGTQQGQVPRLLVYPNPAKNILWVHGLSKAEKYTIFRSDGAMVRQGLVLDDGRIELNDLTSGIYMLRIRENLVSFLISENR